jgi:plasmid stabilization system protein ParE
VSLPVIIRPLAEFDLREAQRWYEGQQPGLGARFRASVDAALQVISGSPRIFPVVHEGIRRASVKRFPYVLYFLLQEHRIVLVACLHVRRGPRILAARLKAPPSKGG